MGLFTRTNTSTMTLKGFSLNQMIHDGIDVQYAASALSLHRIRCQIGCLANRQLMDKMRSALCGQMSHGDLVEAITPLTNVDGLKIIAGQTIRALTKKSDARKKNKAIGKMMTVMADFEVDGFIREADMVRDLMQDVAAAQQALGTIGFDMDEDLNIHKARDLSISFGPGHKFSDHSKYGDGLTVIYFHGPQQDFSERIQTLMLTEPVDSFIAQTIPYQ